MSEHWHWEWQHSIFPVFEKVAVAFGLLCKRDMGRLCCIYAGQLMRIRNNGRVGEILAAEIMLQCGSVCAMRENFIAWASGELDGALSAKCNNYAMTIDLADQLSEDDKCNNYAMTTDLADQLSEDDKV